MLGRLFLSGSLALCLASCQSVRGTANAFEDFFAPIEGFPRYAQGLQTEPLEALPAARRGWREYEIGRRFELGLGVPQDPACALRWYYVAAASPYEDIDWNTASGFYGQTVTRYGLPWARIAIRRIEKSAPSARAASHGRCEISARGQME